MLLEARECQKIVNQIGPGIFSKIEQVKKLEGVLKSSKPKDTEVNAIMAATDS